MSKTHSINLTNPLAFLLVARGERSDAIVSTARRVEPGDTLVFQCPGARGIVVCTAKTVDGERVTFVRGNA